MDKLLKMSSLGEDNTEGVVASVLVAVGDHISIGTIILEVETDKVVIEVPAIDAGIVEEILIGVGDKVSEGIALLRTRVAETEQKPKPEQQPQPVQHQEPIEKTVQSSNENSQAVSKNTFDDKSLQQQHTPFVKGDVLSAGPAVRRMAREFGIDLQKIKGSGLRNRITKKDLQTFAKKIIQQPQSITAEHSAKPLPDISSFGAVHREKMSGIKVATANNMSHCWSQIPHAWLQDKIDVTELEAKRQKYKAHVKSEGASLTLTAIMVKALAKVLENYPLFNSAFDTENKEIVYRDYIDIGVAVDTEKGLVVPALRAADQKSLTEISLELGDLAQRAKNRKLSVNDLSGCGFTLSNLGGMGLTSIFPIVNWPQVAILGVAASTWEPVLVDGVFVPRLKMPVTLAFDHRVINGADGARFLTRLKELLEDPFTFLL